MSVENLPSQEGSTAQGPNRPLLKELGSRVLRLLHSIGLFEGPLDSEGKFTRRELRKQGTELMTEARDIFRGVPSYVKQQTTIYREATYYLSLERPMNIGAEFSTDNESYHIRVTELQDTTPAALLMVIIDKKDAEDSRRVVHIDLRGSASAKPGISVTGATPNTPDAAAKIKQTLAELKTQHPISDRLVVQT